MSDPLFDGPDAPGSDEEGDATELAKLEATLAVFAHDAPLRELPPRPPPVRHRWVLPVVGAAVAAAAVLFVWLGARHEPGGSGGGAQASPCSGSTGFAFSLAAGALTCGGHTAVAGTLPVGPWLETTGANAEAHVAVADIGELTVHGATKLRLVRTGPAEQRLELARGAISARVTAPPRLFVVDTPAASAVDLGCAYDLSTDGITTHLRVTKGAVSLEGKRGVIYVPATYHIDLGPNRAFGLPLYKDASPEVASAVASFGAPGTVAQLVAAAGPYDRVTLWNAITRTNGADRAALVAKLEQLAPLPAPSLHDKVLAGDADALDIWLDVFVDRGDLAHDKRH